MDLLARIFWVLLAGWLTGIAADGERAGRGQARAKSSYSILFLELSARWWAIIYFSGSSLGAILSATMQPPFLAPLL